MQQDIPEPIKTRIEAREKARSQKIKENAIQQIIDECQGTEFELEEIEDVLGKMPDVFFECMAVVFEGENEVRRECEELQEWYDNCPYIPGW